MKKYLANFSVNNGTQLMESLTSTNKQKLAKEIRDIAQGEGHGYWYVLDPDYSDPIMQGRV